MCEPAVPPTRVLLCKKCCPRTVVTKRYSQPRRAEPIYPRHNIPLPQGKLSNDTTYRLSYPRWYETHTTQQLITDCCVEVIPIPPPSANCPPPCFPRPCCQQPNPCQQKNITTVSGCRDIKPIHRNGMDEIPKKQYYCFKDLYTDEAPTKILHVPPESSFECKYVHID